MGDNKKIGIWSLVMMIFVPTFNFINIASNAVYLGPAAIPSWIIVSLLFFLPLCGIIAEMASANRDKDGGIYTWVNEAIGEQWAFVGTWSYFIGILFFFRWHSLEYQWQLPGHFLVEIFSIILMHIYFLYYPYSFVFP